MTSRSGHRQDTMAVVMALALALALAAIVAAPPVGAASPATQPHASSPNRPPEPVAYARIAVVRVLTYYNGTVSSDPAPIPAPNPCIADGAIVGTTGTGLNSFNYALLPTAAVNPITPCPGAVAAFQQLNGNAVSWSISHIDVLLNVAYTGTSEQQMGAVIYSIDPAQIKTNGGANAPSLLTLPLAAPAGTPAHDLPVLATPQPSDPPATGEATLLDLTGVDGAPLGRDALTSGEVKSTLYPVALPVAQLSALPQPTPTATPAQQTGVGGTAVPSAAAQLPTPVPATPAPLSVRISLGAPAIDSNGRLIGMVAANASGAHVLASAADIAHSINAVTGKPGLLMQQWQRGLAFFYATPPSFDDADATFAALTSAYPDFGGVAPFVAAAQNHSTDIPSLTRTVGSALGPPASKGTPGLIAPYYVLAAVVLLVAITLLLLLTLARRGRTASVVANAPLAAPAEPELDLLPPNLTPEELDARLELETTMPLAALHAPARGPEDASTLKLPAVLPPLARVRQGLALMPHAAGVTDAGMKRAADPNQDNILAARGIRQADGRVQPFGLFIVADGMGGHMHGQQASQLAIELVSSRVLQPLQTSQPMPDSAWPELLRGSVAAAGAELCRRNRDERADMGTTLTAALTVDDMAYVANIGDSRTYLMSPETGLRQLTEDHSVVASLVSHGVIRPEDIYTHPRRNQIYRSLGGDHEQVDVDVFEVPLQAGDKLLLCSDGLWEMVRDPQIESILRGTADPRQAADLLLREANANGGEDNISAVVVRLLDDVPQEVGTGSLVVVASPAGEAASDRTGMAQGQGQA